MDVRSRALCYAMRNPPPGTKRYKLGEIQGYLTKRDGTPPSLGAISEAARTFMDPKSPSRRPPGSNKTTKAEDRMVYKTFHKVRPPGCGVDSRILHSALPKKLGRKIGRKTCIRRLAAKGYKADRKVNKMDPGPTLCKKRVAFAQKNKDTAWSSQLQAVGDFKDFTYYPPDLKPKFSKLRAPWTYMTKTEKHSPAFARPKRWFPKKDWKKTKKHKVFGMCTSNGKVLAIPVPSNLTGQLWAKQVKSHVAPFLKKSFPGKASYTILLDGEPLLHSDEAKAVYKKKHITIFPNWPKYSPDLNPQENVWAWAEPHLRTLEKPKDTFAKFQKNVLKAVRAYPSASKLIGSMAKRCEGVLLKQGGMLKQ